MRNEEETKLDFLKGTSLHTIWQSRINNGYDTDASLRRVQWPNHKRQYIKDTASTPGFFLLLSDCGSIDRSNERMIFFSSHHQRHLSPVLSQSKQIARWLLTFFVLPRLPHEMVQATARTTTTKMLLLLFAEPKFGLFWYCNTVLVTDTGRHYHISVNDSTFCSIGACNRCSLQAYVPFTEWWSIPSLHRYIWIAVGWIAVVSLLISDSDDCEMIEDWSHLSGNCVSSFGRLLLLPSCKINDLYPVLDQYENFAYRVFI